MLASLCFVIQGGGIMAKYILLDLDGTIINSALGITKSAQYALKKYGIEVENLDSLRCFIGPPLPKSFMEYYGFDEATAQKAVEAYREYYVPTGIYENTLYPDIVEAIRKIKNAGKTVVLATSKPTVFAKQILEYHKIADLFSFISGSKLDGGRSEKNEIIQYVLDEMQITDKHEVIMVGDRKHDIIGANKVGVSSVGVLYGFGDREEFEKAGAKWIVEEAKHLPEILLK